MKIEKTENNGILTVKPTGRLDSLTSDEFLGFLNQNFTKDYTGLVLDFEKIDFISSKGLRVLVSVYKELGERTMKIVGANTSVYEVIKISGLLKVFSVNE